MRSQSRPHTASDLRKGVKMQRAIQPGLTCLPNFRRFFATEVDDAGDNLSGLDRLIIGKCHAEIAFRKEEKERSPQISSLRQWLKSQSGLVHGKRKLSYLRLYL
jgi:hypothetical protein